MYGESQSLFQQMVFCNISYIDFTLKELKSQSLFQQMVFCNKRIDYDKKSQDMSQSLFQQMVFCNLVDSELILVDDESQSLFQQMVFCNNIYIKQQKRGYESHNPYFSRWFSAMRREKSYVISVKDVTILILVDGFLQFIPNQTRILSK